MRRKMLSPWEIAADASWFSWHNFSQTIVATPSSSSFFFSPLLFWSVARRGTLRERKRENGSNVTPFYFRLYIDAGEFSRCHLPLNAGGVRPMIFRRWSGIPHRREISSSSPRLSRSHGTRTTEVCWYLAAFRTSFPLFCFLSPRKNCAR